MLPLRDFLATNYEYRRRAERRAVWFVGLLMPALLVELALLLSVLPKNPQPDEVAKANVIVAIGVVVILGTMVGGAALVAWSTIRSGDLREPSCPHCDKPFRNDLGVVVATGCCPKCLKQVAKNNPRERRVDRPLLTIAELQSAKKHRRNLLALIMVEFVLVSMIVPLGSMAYQYLIVVPNPEWAPTGLSSWMPWLLMAALGGPLMVGIFYNLWRTPHCPCCRTLIASPSTVISSGNCERCGAAIVADAPGYAEYRPLPKLASVDDATKRFFNRMAVRCLLGMGLAFAVMLGVTAFHKSLPVADIDPATNLARVIVWVGGTLLALAASLLPFLIRPYRRYPELACCHCGETIVDSHTVVRCTGNCPHCGQRAIKDA